MDTLTIHGMSLSGNCYKPRLLLELLGRQYRWREVNLANRESHGAAFLEMNLVGKVPVLQLADGRCLAESNAILCYLARGTEYLPADDWRRAQVLRWLFWEQNCHEPFIAQARFIRKFLPPGHDQTADLPRLLEGGARALKVMEGHLATNDFMNGGEFTLADIALYAYTHCAAEGGFDLDSFPSVCRWLERVASRPGFVPMTQYQETE